MENRLSWKDAGLRIDPQGPGAGTATAVAVDDANPFELAMLSLPVSAPVAERACAGLLCGGCACCIAAAEWEE
jgi:hypothetical protein